MSRLALVVVSVLCLCGCDPRAAIEAVFHRHGEAVVEEATSVAICESGLNPEEVNGQFRGLFQLGHWHDGRPGMDRWRDPLFNALAAEDLWKEAGGWGPWECRPGR